MLEWHEEAACKGLPIEIFFPDEEEDTPEDIISKLEIAMKFCEDCPVLKLCYAHGLKHEDYGIWGASTEKERRSERRRRKK